VQGTRAVQQSILEGRPSADLSVSMVWISILEGDTQVAAQEAAESIAHDSRVRHFYDPHRLAGTAIARGLGGEEGEVAWDIYLFYEEGDEWIEDPPAPAYWVHQVTGSRWADLAHYHSGHDLVREIDRVMSRLL
jgi:hypothetical protein